MSRSQSHLIQLLAEQHLSKSEDSFSLIPKKFLIEKMLQDLLSLRGSYHLQFACPMVHSTLKSEQTLYLQHSFSIESALASQTTESSSKLKDQWLQDSTSSTPSSSIQSWH